MKVSSPPVVILAGPNGAGKSTAAASLLRGTLRVREFVNADVIAQGISGFEPSAAALQAGRVMVARLKSLADKRVDFAFEDHAGEPVLRTVDPGPSVRGILFQLGLSLDAQRGGCNCPRRRARSSRRTRRA